MKIYGKNPVLERLKSNPRSIRKIFIAEGHPEASYIRGKSQKWGIPILTVPHSKLLKLGRSLNTQGLLMEVEDFGYTPYPDLLEQAKAKGQTLLLLDHLTDPQNLGGIIRSAACLGNFAIVLPIHESVEVTETVLRVACGGENFIPIARVSNLGQAIKEAKKSEFWIAGAVVKDGKNLYEVQWPFPLALVVGSEQKGIRDILRKQLDLEVTIPMAFPRLSLNAAHALTAFCYEITKQKNQKQA